MRAAAATGNNDTSISQATAERSSPPRPPPPSPPYHKILYHRSSVFRKQLRKISPTCNSKQNGRLDTYKNSRYPCLCYAMSCHAMPMPCDPAMYVHSMYICVYICNICLYVCMYVYNKPLTHRITVYTFVYLRIPPNKVNENTLVRGTVQDGCCGIVSIKYQYSSLLYLRT